MAYFPVASRADDRRSRALTPIRLNNVMLEPQPADVAARSSYAIVNAPGRECIARLPGNVRGLFSEPGCQGGRLFAAAGAGLYVVSGAWSPSLAAPLGGSDVVQMTALRDQLGVLAGGAIGVLNGATWSPVTDVDAPSPAASLTSSALRLIAARDQSDLWGWSKAGLPLDWDSAGIAADISRPDPIVVQSEIDGDLWSFGARSTQIWRATGGAEAEAFAPVPGSTRQLGVLARNSLAHLGSGGAMVLGSDGVVYRVGAGQMSPIVDESLTASLSALSAPGALGASFAVGARAFYGLRFIGAALAPYYDVAFGRWFTRSRYNRPTYDVGFIAQCYGETVCAGPDDPFLWRQSRDVFDDDGDPILREMTVHVPFKDDSSVDSIGLDITVRGQSMGVTPKALLTFSRDGGNQQSLDALGIEREVDLPAAGNHSARPTAWRFGRAERGKGFLLSIKITDAIGFALNGVFVNEGRP